MRCVRWTLLVDISPCKFVLNTDPGIVCAGPAAMNEACLLSGHASGSDGEDQQDTGNKQVDVEAEDENHTNFFIKKPRFKAILRLYYASIKNLLRLY